MRGLRPSAGSGELDAPPMKTFEQQSLKDSNYIKAYHVWVSSLPAHERDALAAQQLDVPDTSARTSTPDCNEVILKLAESSGPLPGDEMDEETKETDSTPMAVADALASFCARIRSHPNPLLAIDTLCFATGLMGVEGRSQSELAKRHNVTRAAFSRHVITWIDLFQLTPPRGCRSLMARRAYSLSRKASLRKEADHARC